MSAPAPSPASNASRLPRATHGNAGRVARFLKSGNGGYVTAARRLETQPAAVRSSA